MLPILTIVGLVVTVILTLAAVWYASRRLRQLEARLKLGNGLTATHIKDMDKVVADISEVKQGLHSLAQEMGLKFVSREGGQHRSPMPKQPSQQPTSQPSQQPTSQPSQQPAKQPAPQPSQQPTSQSSQQPTQQSSQQPTSQSSQQPTQQSSQQPTQQPSQQTAPQPSQQPAQQPSQQPAPQPSQQSAQQPNQQPAPQPSQQAPTVKKGKGKGKGKPTLLMNLFPEFVGPITIPTETTTSTPNVPRVEEMAEDGECEGGVCAISSK
jgi:hypothetical protein